MPEATNTFRMSTFDEFKALSAEEQLIVEAFLDKCVPGKHLVHIRFAEYQEGDTGCDELWLDALHVCRYADEAKAKKRANLPENFHFVDVRTMRDIINNAI